MAAESAGPLATADACIELAIASHAAGRLDVAIAACERALAIEPRAAVAYGALAWLLASSGRSDALPALHARWAAALPDDPMAVHMHAATAGLDLDRASPAYVTELFDELAPTFDRTLAALEYRAPDAVAAAMLAALPGGRAACCLDAGCGTGLVGERVRTRVDRLVGVDLSGAMLERAAARGIYDAFDRRDLVAHLEASPRTYDAIVAADVLVYFGELAAVAEAIAGALRPAGVVVVTTERSDGRRHALRPTGRFVHHPDAAALALANAGLVDVTTASLVLRRERGVAVDGTLIRARSELASLGPS